MSPVIDVVRPPESKDPADPRLGHFVRFAVDHTESNTLTSSYSIWGYPDDEGIRLNGGRPGAEQAPTAIRKILYKMTPPFDRSPSKAMPFAQDYGDLDSEKNLRLDERHEMAAQMMQDRLINNYRCITLGGGHDYAYGDGKGFLESLLSHKNIKPLILNFDAHLDVRPVEVAGPTSGTPFFRLLQSYSGQFDFAEIGIQAHCNAFAHRNWALSHPGVKIIDLESLGQSRESFEIYVLRQLEEWIIRPRPTFISVDIDAFNSSQAMGASQSWPTGLDIEDFFKVFEVLLHRLDVRTLGIYEVSPPLDQDNRTSKLAALIAHRFLFHKSKQ